MSYKTQLSNHGDTENVARDKIARCSRPLYSSQTTTPSTHTTRAQQCTGRREGGHQSRDCCPRTQQRAKDPTPAETGPAAFQPNPHSSEET
jgi:hypothetical protein